MGNKEIHGKASEEQMKVLEDALRDQGDKAIKAPWEIDSCPPFRCPGLPSLPLASLPLTRTRSKRWKPPSRRLQQLIARVRCAR